MGSTIYEVLDELRATALSEADKGTRFERLIRAYLRVDPVFADQFSDVWPWGDYPGNGGKHDTGIDLVARDRNTGHDVAIQCNARLPLSDRVDPRPLPGQDRQGLRHRQRPQRLEQEVGDPRYIIDLLARIVTVSLETMEIVDNLPALEIRKDQEAS